MSVLGELRGKIEDRCGRLRRARPPTTTSILLIGTDGDTERMVCLWRTEGRLLDCGGGGDFGAGVVETAGPVNRRQRRGEAGRVGEREAPCKPLSGDW